MVEIKNIVFDIYGVIISSGHNIRDILFPIFPKHKKHSYCRKVYHYYAVNKIDRLEFWRLIGAKSEFVELEKMFFSQHKLDNNFYEVIDFFSKKNKKLFILSNIPYEWSKFLENKFKLNKYFLGKVYSWQQGIKKPNPKIFNVLLKKYKLVPYQTMFIDDKIENIRVAKRLKFKTCWYNRERISKNLLSADFKITNLKQLINKL